MLYNFETMRRSLAVVIFLAFVLPVNGQEKGSQPAGDKGHAEATEKPLLPSRTATCKIKEDGTSIECNWAEAVPEGYFKRLLSPENAPNIGLVVVGFLGIIAAICTLRAIEKQAEIASNSQRSWIIPKNVSKPDLSGAWIMKVSCEFEVYGSSPVRVHESKFIFDFIQATPLGQTGEVLPCLPEKPDYGEPDTLSDAPEMGRIWAPGSQIIVSPSVKGLIATKEQLRFLNEGKSVLCIYGFIRYRDAFDKSKTRNTRFCFICGKKGILDQRFEEHFILGGPPAYNDID